MNNTFEIKSGIMVCSDPCYDTAPVVKNVKNGIWEADIDMVNTWGERISMLKVNHVNSNVSGRWELLDFDGGVDSGQFGFFDSDFYRNDEAAKDLEKHDFGEGYDEKEGDSWYRAVCDITLKSEQWGVLSGGAVSSSGYGDGSYNVYGMKDNNGEYVAFFVQFIDEEDEDEEDYEDEF